MERLNQWMMLAANLGVLAGIVFLAFEISQNTAALQAGATQDVSRAASELSLSVVHSDYLPAILIKDQVQDPLTPEEAYRLNMYWFSTMRNFESYFFQWQAGFIDDELFGSRRAAFGLMLGQQSTLNWWKNFKGSFSSKFREYVDAEVIGL